VYISYAVLSGGKIAPKNGAAAGATAEPQIPASPFIWVGTSKHRSTKTADGILCAVVVKLADGKHWRIAAAYKDGQYASNQNDAARLQQLRAKNPVADPA
jgi:hypothetical protein